MVGMSDRLKLVMFALVAMLALVLLPASADCPSAPECKCSLGTPTVTAAPTPPACCNHTDAAVVGDGTAKDGCCRISGSPDCTSEVGCYFKVSIIAVGNGSGCDFSISGGGSPIATCPVSPCTSLAFVSSAHALSCGSTEEYTVRVAGVRVASVRMACDGC